MTNSFESVANFIQYQFESGDTEEAEKTLESLKDYWIHTENCRIDYQERIMELIKLKSNTKQNG